MRILRVWPLVVLALSCFDATEPLTHLKQTGSVSILNIEANESEAMAVNDNGDIVGFFRTAGSTRSFVIQDGTVQTLPTQDDFDYTAREINNAGQVLGTYDDGPGIGIVMWDHGSAMVIEAAGAHAYRSLILTDQGDAVWTRFVSSSYTEVYTFDGVNTDTLPTLGGPSAFAYAANEVGVIAGWATTLEDDRHAVLWTGTTITDLGTLGGAFSEAYDVNDRGDVVGMSETVDGDVHAFLYTNGTMIDLTPDVSGESASALSVTNAGVVAGLYRNGVEGVGFVWRAGNLETFGPFGTRITAIAAAENGAVVGHLVIATVGWPYALIDHELRLLNLGEHEGGTLRALNRNGTTVGWVQDSDGIRRAAAWHIR